MKKTFKSFAMLAVMLLSSFLCSCQALVENTLKEALEEAKAEYPMVIDEGLTVDDITLGDNGIVYHVTVNESVYDIDAIKISKAEMKEGVIEGLKESIKDDNDVKTFIKLAVASNKPISYLYEGDTSGDNVRIKISVAELKRLLDE